MATKGKTLVRGRPRRSRPAPKGFKRPAQFSAAAHIGINQVYARIKDGTLPHVRLGRTILIPDDALDRLVTTAGNAA